MSKYAIFHEYSNFIGLLWSNWCIEWPTDFKHTGKNIWENSIVKIKLKKIFNFSKEFPRILFSDNWFDCMVICVFLFWPWFTWLIRINWPCICVHLMVIKDAFSRQTPMRKIRNLQRNILQMLTIEYNNKSRTFNLQMILSLFIVHVLKI